MQALVHEGILRGAKGPKGGYTLAREKRKIKTGDIFRVVLKLDYHTKKPKQTHLGQAVVLPFVREMKKELVLWLDKTTIEDLVEEGKTLYQVEKNTDFSI
jgi:DNA-binding IscR family transcriptional regulator